MICKVCGQFDINAFPCKVPGGHQWVPITRPESVVAVPGSVPSPDSGRAMDQDASVLTWEDAKRRVPAPRAYEVAWLMTAGDALAAALLRVSSPPPDSATTLPTDAECDEAQRRWAYKAQQHGLLPHYGTYLREVLAERAGSPPPAPSGEPTDEAFSVMRRAGYVLAMEVLQSPLYAKGDDELRNAVAMFVSPRRAGEPSVARRTAGDGQTEDREVGAPGISGSSSPVPAPSPEAPHDRCPLLVDFHRNRCLLAAGHEGRCM